MPTFDNNANLQFAGTTELRSTNNSASGITVRTITFNSGAGAFTLLGTNVNLANAAGILNNSTNTQTISFTNLALGAAAMSMDATSGELVINSTLTGANGFDVTGTRVTLRGANTHTGANSVTSGALRIADSSALGTTAGGTTVASGAVLELSNNISVGAEALSIAGAGITNTGALRNVSGTNTYGGAITLTAAALIEADADSELNLTNTISGNFLKTFDGGGNIDGIGIISGSGGVVKSGAGTLTLSAANTFTGNLTNSGGTVRAISNAGALGAGNVTMSGGSIELANDTGLNFADPVVVSSSATITSDRLTAGTGVTHTLGLLTNGAQTINIAKGANVTGGTAGVTFGNVVLNANGATYNAGEGTLLTLGGITGNTFGFTVGGAGNTTISGVVGTTTGTVSKTGAGTLTMSSAANTYGGVTTIGGGVLSAGTLANAGANSSIGTNATIAISNAGKLHYTGGTVAINRGVNLSGGNGDISVSNSAAALTISGAISNSGTLVKSGAGTLILTASNNYQGGTLLSAGTLAAGNLFAFGSGSVTIGSGTTLNLSNFSIANTLINNGGTLTNLGTVSGAELNAGTTTIASTNSTVAEVSGTASVTVAGVNTTLTNLVGGTLNVTGTNTTVQSFSGGSISNATTVTVQAGTSSGTISGAGRLIKSGAGTLTLGGANTYAGGTTISNGTLRVGDGGAAGTLGTGNVTNNATLVFNRSDNIVVGNNISGSGSLGKVGANTLTLTGANTFSGGLSITGGAISVADENSLGSASNAITLDNGKLVTTATVDLGPGRSIVFGAGGGTFDVAAATTATVDGLFSGNGSFTKIGSGTIALDAASSGYAGNTFINGGTLRLNDENVLASSAVTVASGATLSVNFGNASIGALGGSGNIVVASNAVVGGLNTSDVMSGVISGNGSLTKTGGGTLTLATNNAHAGGVVLNGNGAVRAQSAGAFGSGLVQQASGSSRLIIDATGTVSNAMSIYNISTLQTVTLSGAKTLNNATYDVTNNTTTTETGLLSGDGGVTKIGAGTLVLAGSANNTYTGATVISNGALVLSNSAGNAINGSSGITVNSGTSLILGASNQIGDGVGLTLNGGTFIVGTASAGYSETLGTLTLSASSTIDLGSYSTGLRQLAFADSSAITWTGTLTITNWQGLALQSSDVAEVLFGTGGLTTTQLGQIYFANQDINGGVLVGGNGELVPIPEAEVYWGALAIALAVGYRERRRLVSLLRQVRR